MSSSSSFRKQNEFCFFFNQTEITKAPNKRPKKLLDENGLSRKLNSKYHFGAGSDLSGVGGVGGGSLDDGEGTVKSLSERLAQLTTVAHSVSSLNSGTHSRRSSLGPNAYTDTRLQAIRFLTDDMIKELEFFLVTFSNAQAQPNLPGSIIYEFHSDWTDLTETCVYSNFPMWRTKNGRDSQMKKMSDMGQKRENRNGSSSNVGGGGEDGANDIERSSSSRKSHIKNSRQVTKLGSINELRKKSDSSAGKPSDLEPVRNSRNQMAQSGNNTRRLSVIKALSPKSRTDAASRLTHNTSNSTGCLVNYQLSNYAYKDKGWTVMNLNAEEQFVDNERKILAAIKNSLDSM